MPFTLAAGTMFTVELASATLLPLTKKQADIRAATTNLRGLNNVTLTLRLSLREAFADRQNRIEKDDGFSSRPWRLLSSRTPSVYGYLPRLTTVSILRRPVTLMFRTISIS